ncbi:hypothetical protein AB4Z09_06355 [Rhodococcus sp. TAF43]|uniref:hypothetical protein n=1 Tax=Rhodococcus sp. TAF43 TaxID=3237483 RepID=UPI003F9ACAF1
MELRRGKSASKGDSTTENATTSKTWAIGLAVALGGVLLLWISSTSWLDELPALETTITQLGGLLVTTGVLAVIWELIGKREIMDEILEKTKVSSDVHSAGIQRATTDWTEPPWETLFKEARTLSIFISYGSGWRSAHWPKLREFTQDKSKVLRVYLPDPDDALTMEILASRYNYSLDMIRSKVTEAAQVFASLSAKDSADIRVHYRAGDHTYACYKFDEKIIATLYSNARERGEVPVMLVSSGTFYDFFAKDLDAIERQSIEIPLGDITKTGEANKVES